ncbi:MAG: AMP-binding protein [Alphaproteobacteria bacterium]|nr:AMP-binding protein [Alphaproteobacteria bacterium]
MTDVLTDLAARLGTKTALIDDRPDSPIVSWTFAELEANANRLARLLISLGVQPKDRIVSCGQNSCWLVAMSNAVRKIGAVGVPLNYRLTPDEATYVVDNSDAVVVFADTEFADFFARIRKHTPKVRDTLIFDGPAAEGQKRVEPLLQAQAITPVETDGPPLEPMTMIYTSGTTGKPKGAVRSSLGNPAQSLALWNEIGYVENDVYITTGPLYHSGPGGFLTTAHRLGNTAVLQHKFDEEDWLRLVQKYRVTTTFAAPTPIRRICQLPDATFKRYDVTSMARMVANAAPWSYALKQLYLSRFPKLSLFEVYGSTELGVNTVLRPEHQLSKPGSCGRAAPGVEIRLFDDSGNVVSTPNTEGELYVKSANMFSTYHKAHDKFMADRRDGWQTVGDIATFDEEGFYYICDRKKDMIISGGVNIYPAEIEAALETHPDINDVAVFGIPDEEWGEAVHAIVVVRPGVTLTKEQITAYAREHLAGYKVPRSLSYLTEIPRTGSGKILKRDLRKPFWEGRKSRV